MAKQHEIKRAQRESYYYREIANLFRRIAIDDSRLDNIFINKVTLSSDGGTCIVLFLAQNGPTEFQEKLQTLILYKPSVRAALAKMSHGRYTPNLIFRYDEDYAKTEKIHLLLDRLKKEGRL